MDKCRSLDEELVVHDDVRDENASLRSMADCKDDDDDDDEQTTTSPPSSKTLRRSSVSCVALKHAVSSLYRLDDFTREPLGRGFFSEVFKVTHKTSGVVMVLKLNTLLTNRPNMLREVQLMNKLSHPNILRFVGACVHGGQLHALTEFINGGSLEELLADDTVILPWPKRILMATHTARGMCYLHSQGIMHRDLTSKNVLIRKESEAYHVVVADFGLATKIPDPSRTESLPIVGSPYWMSPECINGKLYDEKADVFSYGIIMCEIIARIEADPDILPRTSNFGIDYVAFSKLVKGCPLNVLHLAFNCCQIDPKKRPSFRDVTETLDKIKSRSQMAVVLADIGSLNVENSENIMNKTMLERILDGRGHKRHRSDEAAAIVMLHEALGETEIVRVETPVVHVVPAHDFSRDCIIPVTPLVVGQVMSQEDRFYTPHKNNPFVEKFADASTKLVGSVHENWAAWFDLRSPSLPLTPPVQGVEGRPTRGSRRCRSLPSSPSPSRRFDAPPSARRTFSQQLPFLRRMDSAVAADSCDNIDTRSEGSSSADSALGVEFFSRGETRLNASRRFPKPSVEMLNLSWDRYRFRAEILARSADNSDVLSPRSRLTNAEDFAASYSSSESCLSLDEAAILSPTSSYSSYGDADDWSHSRAQLELYEHRLRARERFQELVSRWEAKQTLTLAPSEEAEHPSGDLHLERKFQELRRKFESDAPSLAPPACSSVVRFTSRSHQGHLRKTHAKKNSKS